MKLSKQVTSLEISKKLKELGVKQESYFKWHYIDDFATSTGVQKVKPYWRVADVSYRDGMFSAFTVAELGEMLPNDYISGQVPLDAADGKWKCLRLSFPEFEPWNKFWEYADTEADARGKMLIYLLENKLI